MNAPSRTPAPASALGRRTFLTTGAGVAFSVAAGLTGASSAQAATVRQRAYVLVIDGCRPDELDTALTPHLTALSRAGLRFPSARSLPVMETIPNHVMMMTGVRPDRSGVPANSFYDRAAGEVRDMDQPDDITIDTIIERLNRAGLRTGTVLSKEYLYGVFGDRATHRWEPEPLVPITNHALDGFTITAAKEMVTEFDPHFMFVNLGDIDRFGHTDLSGTGLRIARRAALANTDRLIGTFVAHLKERGLWRHALLTILADHSMDWSSAWKVISLSEVLEEDPLLSGKVEIAQNGGADLLYWTGAETRRAAAIRRMVALIQAVEGVDRVLPRTTRSLRLGAEAGDVVAFCRAGWRFSDPTPLSNPIPGNHGHFATQAIPFFLTGGHPRVPTRTSSTARAHTVDVAPTVMSFFGLPGHPRGGWDGTARI
ncbi:MAG: alkaline phosphatase family protein [Nocardioides sp.]|uniref:alkaline phosphatase family protein n=1 Tax=Nocardioides sp. TaxID=35761 RepID=UPI0039E48094